MWASELRDSFAPAKRDLQTPYHVSVSSDLGIGIRVAGGVGCEKCGELHTVITDVTTTDIPNQYKGWHNDYVDDV